MTEKKMQIKPYPLGAHRESDNIRFSFVSEKQSCGVIIYDKVTGKKIKKLPFLPQERMGRVHCKYLQGIKPEDISYQFYEEDTIIPDEHARGFAGKARYGKPRDEKDLKAVLIEDDFDWENDKNPKLSYSQSVFYCMHVRGFTKHSSSKVLHKGTYLGVVEKIPYLKESGITTLELQPAYEFMEIMSEQECKKDAAYITTDTGHLLLEHKSKLNYWGYKKGYYYAPKASYAFGDNPSVEFKTMVKELHKNNMEVIMQFYFPKEAHRGKIAEILRFWVLEYHVDGFHLMGDDIPTILLAKDAALADTKLMYYSFNTEEIYGQEEQPVQPNLAEYRDDYLYTMRRFLKSDEDMLSRVLEEMRYIPQKTGRIHYMSNYYGLTLMDMVSYDRKHNEDNGEENRDGNDHNCSWNCGEEGNTRKKKIISLRKRQIKNAMCLLALTQSTPLIFMGDEFGNTQFGNNNPYCQDNKIAWLDWRELEKNQEIYSFWKSMMELRRNHPILHPEKELRIMDYIACGYPDLSYHGQNAWRPRLEGYNRHIGLMYCGMYAKKDRFHDDDFFYVAINMHWEPHELAMPKLPKGMLWQKIISTDEQTLEPVDNLHHIAGRSITVFKSVLLPEEADLRKRRTARSRKIAETVNDRTIF